LPTICIFLVHIVGKHIIIHGYNRLYYNKIGIYNNFLYYNGSQTQIIVPTMVHTFNEYDKYFKLYDK